ncbi:MAG: NUDIX domain-containing protein [bacterium]|nr:NUDIX domain-containing protein [bacterium]
MNKSYIDKLAYIEIKDRKLLVTLSKGKDVWYIPGGKRDGEETDIQALVREVKEELTVDIILETVKLYGVFEAQAHGKPEGTVVRMTCYTASYNGILTPAAEINKVDYFEYSKKTMCSPVDNLIFDDLKTKELID